MGKAAGRAMAGAQAPYRHLPFFYSDLFELGDEAVGSLDPRLEIASDWKDPFREALCTTSGTAGSRAPCCGTPGGQVDTARRLTAEPGPFRPGDLKGRLRAKG